jgi:thiosulfate/3-mercaptopyruvate sulfurtransferase
MTRDRLPLLLEPDELQAALDRKDLLMVDLSNDYDQGHIPGTVHLDYARVVNSQPPIKGLMPEPPQLHELFSSLGLDAETHVVAYDDEGGGRAARFLWTLEAVGHTYNSLLDGGITAWLSEHRPTDLHATAAVAKPYSVHLNEAVIADKNYILDHLHDPTIAIIDCRTPEEYAGEHALARRGGHIPGAVNIEWTRAIDQQRHLRLKSVRELRTLYEDMGITPDKEIITYCHSHRRSAHSYFVLKTLGYPRLRGYPGSWSEWGNDPDTPVDR